MRISTGLSAILDLFSPKATPVSDRRGKRTAPPATLGGSANPESQPSGVSLPLNSEDRVTLSKPSLASLDLISRNVASPADEMTTGKALVPVARQAHQRLPEPTSQALESPETRRLVRASYGNPATSKAAETLSAGSRINVRV